jgi:predicted AAA+ superfamily ATPase
MEIKRKYYLDILNGVFGTDFIKIITGIRRCGKSTLLKQFLSQFKKDVLYINFDEKENAHLLLKENLEKYIDDFIKGKNKVVLALDEIQNVIGFEQLILGYYQYKNIQIYLTGSNSHMISKQIATRFTGRELQINITPFSFFEFHTFFHQKNVDLSFQDYRIQGGLPGFFELIRQPKIREESMNSLIDTIIARDLIPYFKIKNIPLLYKILEFAFDNIGNQFSSTNVINYLNSNTNYKNIPAKTIDVYLSYLIDGFLFYKVHRRDIKGMSVLKTLYTVYATDLLMRNLYIHKDSFYNQGKQLENIVFFELKKRFTSVHIGYFKIKDAKSGK